MSVAGVIFLILGILVVWALVGYVSGRICAEIIHRKDKELSEVFWFWFGVIFTCLAVLLTLVVERRNPEDK